MQKTAELVYNLRDRAGLTQAELARRMGTTQSSIARIESGGSLPTVGMLARVARAMGISLRWQHRVSTPSSSAAPASGSVEGGRPSEVTVGDRHLAPPWNESWNHSAVHCVLSEHSGHPD
jgi:transcriptional regulator with XRE-family HTH domain